jgi:GNAT superfamily N-acetyltransferase
MPARAPAVVEIRTMRADDLERVVEILGCWGMAPVAPSPERPVTERSGLEAGRTLVALVEGRIVGVASYVIELPRFAVTESLAVDPAWLGHGIGERLHRSRLDILRAKGIEKVRTEADRPRTIEWYVKHFGCRIVGTIPKKHPFGLEGVNEWTLLEPDLQPDETRRSGPD